MNTAHFLVKSDLKFVDKSTYTWQTPSNIALVKYWGKSNPQIPKNASISFTLNNCHTITTIEFDKKEKGDAVEFDLFFEGKQKDAFKPKIAEFFARIQEYCPYIFEYKMIINSENSFPHSSGAWYSRMEEKEKKWKVKGRERWREKRKKVQRRVKKKGKREAKGQIRDAKAKGDTAFLGKRE